MNKKEAIELSNKEGWTKADAARALESIDFKKNKDVDELTIRRATSTFAGWALIDRQKSQATQKRFVTIKTKKIAELDLQIEEFKQKLKENHSNSNGNSNHKPEIEKELTNLIEQNRELIAKQEKLIKANHALQKDNKNLKNIVDAIKLRFTIETKHLLKLENSELKQGLIKLLHTTLG